jgi:ribosome biogenesis ATPase
MTEEASPSSTVVDGDVAKAVPVKPFSLGAGLSNFYMSIPKANMPVAAVMPSTGGSTPPANEEQNGQKKRVSLEEQIKKRIKSIATSSESRGPNKNSTFDAERLVEYPTQRYRDFGALNAVIEDIKEFIERPFQHPEIYAHLGVEVPRGVLLFGPPGCGKTNLARAIAGELGVALFKVAAPEIVSGMSGESEAQLRELFEAAKRMAPSIIFIDEIDAITPKRENAQREMERRIVAQLLTCMDELNVSVSAERVTTESATMTTTNSTSTTSINSLRTLPPSVLVIGATNRPDSLDPALRRAGRFDREIQLSIPDERGREQILRVLAEKLRICGTVDWGRLARQTPGFVGADLKALMREAASTAISRIFKDREQNVMVIDDAGEACTDTAICNNTITSTSTSTSSVNTLSQTELEGLFIEEADFLESLKKVQPSAKREGFAVVPDITWEDIGALSYVREELRMAVVEPLRHPELFASVGLTAPAGVLLFGPPGCGKTLLAKAVAHETHSNFISVKGPELLNKYVGESERAVRQVFERAAASAPCVIFFDEIDALCPRRAMSDSGNESSARIVNQLLTELDGLEGRRQVYILAATNRPDLLDPALTRPGRLDKALCVRLPNRDERSAILKTCGRKTPWHCDVDLDAVAADPRTDGFSGADLAALIREAAVASIRSYINSGERRSSGGSGRDSSKDSNSTSGSGSNNYITTTTITTIPPLPPPPPSVTKEHLEIALSKIKRSVTPADEILYNRLRSRE